MEIAEPELGGGLGGGAGAGCNYYTCRRDNGRAPSVVLTEPDSRPLLDRRSTKAALCCDSKNLCPAVRPGKKTRGRGGGIQSPL